MADRRRPFVPVLTGWHFTELKYHSPTCPLHFSRNTGTPCTCHQEPDYAKMNCRVVMKDGRPVYKA